MDASDEKVSKAKKQLDASTELLKTSEIRGTSTETHARRGTPDLKKEDFQFNLPKEAMEKKSVFDDSPAKSGEQEVEGK